MMTMQLHGSALFSPEGHHRYTLTRQWSSLFGGGSAAWMLFNPSTADALKDDPTIRRVISFSKAAGWNNITIFNLIARRATDPNDLIEHAPAEKEYINKNFIEIARAIRQLDHPVPMVCAWGGIGESQPAIRPLFHMALVALQKMVWENHDKITTTLHIAATDAKGQHPRHPLYQPTAAPLIAFDLNRYVTGLKGQPQRRTA